MRRSNPDCFRGDSLDCFASLAMTERVSASLSSRAPDTARRLFDGALLSRGPCHAGVRGFWVPALRRNACALRLVRDTRDWAFTPCRARPSAAGRSRPG
ncbi:hypothetical protein CVM73_00025 [Bradyrhizobium forestalis]|uniref:Uncharacterized protein n=1 Tax=Bradyrhizobium forestalis TaxID=1419263 RepID=A0A2M8RG95_9BRAD|nr:hypothetical protein CVM73_00025 [Bradyrhizobium forestalis]